MLRYYIITCRSLTYAQRAARLLERSGLTATVAKVPQQLVSSGCGYGVRIHAQQLERARRILQQGEIAIGKILALDEDGAAVEVNL